MAGTCENEYTVAGHEVMDTKGKNATKMKERMMKKGKKEQQGNEEMTTFIPFARCSLTACT